MTVITDADRRVYAADGVVCVRSAIAPERARDLLAAWHAISGSLADHGLEHTSKERRRATPGAFAVKHLSRSVDAFADYIRTTPIPSLVGALTGSRSVGFYWDQMFVKEPGTSGRTPWHNDAAGHPLQGSQIVGVWMPLTNVSPENGLECLAGSHLAEETYWPATAAGDHTPPTDNRRRCPDFETERSNPNHRFLGWDMEPGDALFIHPRTLHFSRGNTTADRTRIAYATWWHGDDVTWDVRPECEPLPPDVTAETAVRGTRPAAPSCPILWRS